MDLYIVFCGITVNLMSFISKFLWFSFAAFSRQPTVGHLRAG